MLAPAATIDDRRALAAAVQRLSAQPRIACDTESNSLHAYRGRTCLIQFSTPAEDLLIDPLAIADVGALAPVFADPAIEIVFHAAEYDLICLKRDFDFDVRGVFDTMAAARVCGYQRIGLGNMLEDLLCVRHGKKHQTDDWARRPLPASYRRYAQMDTHYLLPLRDALHAELSAADRLEEAREYFDDVARFELKSEDFDPDGFWNLFRPNSLDRQQIAVLRELYILRDELAQSVDHPPHRLISNKTLLQLAKSQPKSLKRLHAVRGLPAWLLRQSGDEFIEAVKHGLASRLTHKPPRQEPIPQAIVDRYSALVNWRKEAAAARGVESDVIISRDALWAIARRKPRSVAELGGIRGLGPWRRRTYGAALIAAVNGRAG
ncbi:MAG: HRDC domain-containing protein [Chloroflexi bacterium]|nr:HRDC domain-containing protein [Chloroflexota bacterium]